MGSVRVLYFAACRDEAGLADEALDVGDATVRGVLARIASAHPRLRGLIPRCRVAVNGAFVSLDADVPDRAEVALIPPVAGG